MTNIIEALNWRYAIKQYDPEKKLTEEQVNTLFEAVRMSPSSFGLQPYKIINIKNPEIRAKLRAAGYNQPQITDASQFLVFTVPTNLGEKDVDAFIQLTAETRGASLDSLKDYSDMLKKGIAGRTPEQNIVWAAKQAYIALGVLLTSAAIEKIDASPMEGFDPKQFDEILGLKEYGLTSVVIAALGFRSPEDKYTKLAKVRLAKEDLFIEV